jgi:hypothetical protein
MKSVNLTDVERLGSEGIYGVVTVTGERVDFDEPSNDIRNDTIYATVGQSPCAIALDEVQQLRLKRSEPVGAGIVAAVFVVLIAAAVASSVKGPMPGSGG